MKCMISALLALSTALPALAGDLKMGDPPPELKFGQWVQGDPIAPNQFRGRITAVCFWSFSCPGGPDVMQELSSIQKNFATKGVVVIGISDDEAGTIRAFLKRHADKTAFRFVIDKTERGDAGSAVEGDGLTRAAYFKQFGVNDLPYAFIIDRSGRLAWRGHPLINNMEDALAAIVDNKWDAVRRGMLEDYFALVRAGEAAKAREIAESLVRNPGEDPDIPCTLSMIISRTPDIKKPDYDIGLQAAKLAHQALPNDPRVLGALGLAHARMDERELGIKYLKEAIERANDPYNRAGLTKELKRLEAQNRTASSRPAGDAAKP